MEMQQAQMQYQEEEYQSTFNSPQTDTLTELLLASSDQKLVDIILRLKSDPEKLGSLVTELKSYAAKKKDSVHLKKLQNKILNLVSNIKEGQRYTQTDKQKCILWFFDKICCNDKILGAKQKAEDVFLKIFKDFTHFEDLSPVLKLARNIYLNTKLKNATFPFSERLNYLFNEKFEKLELPETQLKFGETMKNLDEESKLIVKIQIISFFTNDYSKWKIDELEFRKIVSVLNEKPYKKLLQKIIEKKSKASKQIVSSILKSKMEVNNGQIELIFGSKCQIHPELKTKESFELAANFCDGDDLIPQIDGDSIILHGQTMFTKWPTKILASAKQRLGYSSTTQQSSQGFLNLLTFLKKIFQHRHKHIITLDTQNKMIEEVAQNVVPKENIEYISNTLQLFVRFLSYHTLEINHRSHNLSELIPVAFLDEILLFFQNKLNEFKLQSSKIQEQSQKVEKQGQPKKEQRPIILETIDYLITFAAHLFYRRDFQPVTAITSKTSQILVRILLSLDSFPIKWTVLRNYKLVIDRWGQSVEQGSEDYKKLARKFIETYFDKKVTVQSKSSSTVFNPIFITRPYCKIFGSEFLKAIESFEKSLNQYELKNPNIAVSRQLNSKMSKIILFMSARVRFQDANMIGEILGHVYRRHAHVIPEIYLFRVWIQQVHLKKITQGQISQKVGEVLSTFKGVSQCLRQLPAQKLLTPLSNLNQEQNKAILKQLRLYKQTHSRLINCLELKSKTQEYGQIIIRTLWQVVKKHIELFYELEQKVKEFKKDNIEEYNAIMQENELMKSDNIGSAYSTVQQILNNFVACVRFYLCSPDKLLTVPDHSCLVRALGEWMRENVNEAEKDKGKFFFVAQYFAKIMANGTGVNLNTHLEKKQILGAMRTMNNVGQVDLNKAFQTPFNEISSLYEEIKPVYTQFIKLLVKPQEQNITKPQNQLLIKVLQTIILPSANIFGQGYFNGKIEDKCNQDMVLGIYLEQAEAIFKNFNVDEILALNQFYNFVMILEITKNKQSKIVEQKLTRANQGNIFNRPNRAGLNDAMEQLRQINIPQDYIQLALENIEVPDAQLALEWIQNNRERMEDLVIERVLKTSKEQTMMKQVSQKKLQVGKVTPIKYNQFVEGFEKALKQLVKGFAKQLFQQKGQKIVQVLFVILDSFKMDYKKKQYQNFAKKMFQQINALNVKQKFDDKKYRLILNILNITMKKQPELFNNYFKEGICLKVLSFVELFANGLTDQNQQAKQKKEDFYQLLEIINKTLPQFKAPIKEVNPELVLYLNCLLDIISLSSLGNKDVWQILYKVALIQNNELKKKTISLFSSIVLSKQILQEDKKRIKNFIDNQKSTGIFSKAQKSLSSKLFMLPLVKILLEQDQRLLVTNIQLQIKGYILENHQNELKQYREAKQKKDKLVLQVDLKRFSVSFDNFNGSKSFEDVFKKLFTKKKNKKGSIFYDVTKHPLYESQFYEENNRHSFIKLKFQPYVQQILSTLISRPVMMSSKDKELQEQSLIDLYKFLDYFKVLIPAALKVQWWSSIQNKKTNLTEWLVYESIAQNKKKFQFIAFLAMNNHLYSDEEGTVAQYVANRYINVFRQELSSFRQFLAKEQKLSQGVKQQSIEEQRIKKVLLSLMYLLQVQKFNSQVFLKLEQKEQSLRELIQEVYIKVHPTSSPIIYTLLSEIVFILSKAEMITLLKQNYEIVSQQALNVQQLSNPCLRQFLNMSLVYRVDPGRLGEKVLSSKSSKKNNIFNGSSGRIVVDEVDDEDDDQMGMEQIDEEGQFQDSISSLLRVRYRQGEGRNDRVQGTEQYYLEPLEFAPQIIAENQGTQVIQNQNQQTNVVQQGENVAQQEQPVAEQVQQSQKIQEQVKQQKQQLKPMSKIDYLKLLEEKAIKLQSTLKKIESLLPQSKTIALSQKQSSQKMVSQQQQQQKSSHISSLSTFTTTLSTLIQQNSSSKILPPNTLPNPNAQINPEFTCKLVLNDGLQKLSRFQKRFKSFVNTFYPEMKSSSYENDYSGSTGNIFGDRQERGDIPNARWLLSRLQRHEAGENRDQIIYHIERILNQRRQEVRQDQNTRSRPLNLNQAIQDLPQQPQPPKVEEKPKNSEEKLKAPEEKPKQEEPKKQQEKVEEPKMGNNIAQLPVQEKIVEQKVQEQKPSTQQLNEPEKKQYKMQEQKQEKEAVQQKEQQKIQQKQSQMVPEQIIPQNQIVQQPNVALQGPILPEQPLPVNVQQPEIPPPAEFIQQPEQVGPYRQILAMFGLPQTFLADNGIDPQSFDCLPQQFQIDQITHYMNQAQNRANINQLNQANQQPPPQQPAQQNAQGQEQAPQQNQPANNVNEVLQQNIALFASMDPQTRVQMLADYPPEFLMQLPVQMRTQVEQYQQRRVNRIMQEEDAQQQADGNIFRAIAQKNNKRKDQKKQNLKYPSPKDLQFNPISQSLAEHLSRCIFLKVQKSKVIEGFRILLENYLTQDAAIATIIGVLRLQQGFKVTELEYKTSSQGPSSLESIKQQPSKGYWKFDTSLLSDVHEVNSIKENLLNLVLETLTSSIYRNDEFLTKKISSKNFLYLKIETISELNADEEGLWPLYELLPYSLELCPKLTVQILKRVKQLPLRLIKNIVQAIRADKLTTQIYKNLEFLSKNQDMKQLFMEQFPESKPLKLEIFAKVIKYEFARVPYLKKLHEQALNFYSAEYNEFLNQIFGIYSPQDIKQIESILIKHKHVHFQVIKYLYSQNRVLDKEPMGLILKMPHLLDFETKKYLFRKHPKIRRASRYRLPIQVSRGNILQESYNQIMSKTPKQLEGRLQITFMDQQGYDAGGLTREWLLCLSREIFRPDYALFEPSSSGNTYQPNPKSYVNPDHLQYFKFIGRFVGKALAENQLVDAYFTRAVYKMILGQEIELSDLEQQDYSFYKSMLWLKQNPIEQGDYTFSYLYDNFGQRIVKDLIPGGRNINVTQANKLEYIEKYCLAKMRDDFKAQMQKFLEGFHEIVPHECISFFEAKQLQLLISGLPEINFEDLKNNVDYSGFSPTDQAIKWFWEVVQEFTQEDLARLIQFITGTSKIPVDGFANIKGMNGPQRISIHKDPNHHQLPKAHTCFNQLDLPNYQSKQLMRQRIVTAITWGSEGFGFM